MSFFKKILSSLTSSHEMRARSAVREELLSLSEHRLVDLGFDRSALLDGVKAWPWRLQEQGFVAAETESQPVFSRRELRRAERELAAMSDRELFELGIARSEIRLAVNGNLVRVA